MIASTMSFRDLDKKYFLIENKKNLKKIYKIIKRKKTYLPLLVFIYVDMDLGLCMRVLSSIICDNNKLLLDERAINKKTDVILYDEFREFSLILLNDSLVKHIDKLDNINDEFSNLYSQRSELDLFINNTYLDEKRSKVNPYIISSLIINENKDKDFIEVLITNYNTEKDYYLGVLCEQPKLDFSINKNDNVVLKYVDRPNYKGLVIVKKI